jgi:ribosomal protein S18 acetylase RimI-like enzyme
MEIRVIRDEDIPACGAIYASAFAAPPYREAWDAGQAAEMLSELLKKDPESCWCVEEDGELAGFAFCTVFGRFRATIQEFAVAPRFQRKGLGRALMKHVLEELERRSVRTVDLVVNRDAPAFALYRKFGFRQPDRYVLMAKWLRPLP